MRLFLAGKKRESERDELYKIHSGQQCLDAEQVSKPIEQVNRMPTRLDTRCQQGWTPDANKAGHRMPTRLDTGCQQGWTPDANKAGHRMPTITKKIN
jgi:hypothetical protein